MLLTTPNTRSDNTDHAHRSGQQPITTGERHPVADESKMNRTALSEIQLLDLAREVLSVCNDHSLKDVIEDLTITRNSEQTINRILDGQVCVAPWTLHV